MQEFMFIPDDLTGTREFLCCSASGVGSSLYLRLICACIHERLLMTMTFNLGQVACISRRGEIRHL